VGAFQIVYDDFSGGQYMGAKPSNQPKNTWHGNDVITSPTGELIPTGSKRVMNYLDPAGTSFTILDHWVVGDFGYLFVVTTAGSNPYRMYRYSHTNGTTFPVTPTNSQMNVTAGYVAQRNIAFSSVTNTFYYASSPFSAAASFHRITTGGVSSTMTGTVSALINGVVAYGLRLVAWANNNNRLYYTSAWSGTDFGSWSNTQYYELDSKIRMVYARTDDLLIVCEYGIYSLTGVLGSGVNIQLLSPGSSFADGMQYGDVVNRSLYYLDYASSGGTLDGRLHQFIGATTRPIGVFQNGDYEANANGFSRNEPGRVNTISGARTSTTFSTGYVYFETTPGVFGRSKVHNLTLDNSFDMYKPAKCGPNAPNEYILTAAMGTGTGGRYEIYRTYTNVNKPTYLDANFSTSTSSTCTDEPIGTVELSEYWHQKPFTVKEMFIEYSAETAGSVSAYIEPTGVVDVPAATLPNVTSQTISEVSPPVGGYRMYRYWPNNASKGFGAKPILTINNCAVKRVILNCED